MADEAILKVITVGAGGAAGGGGGASGGGGGAPPAGKASGPPSPGSAGKSLGQIGGLVGGVPGAAIGVGAAALEGLGVGAALIGLHVAAVAAAGAVGDFAATMVASSSNASQAASIMGKAGKDAGLAIAGIGAALTVAVGPIGLAVVGLGIFTGVVGQAAESLGKLMDALDGMVDRYAQYSPGLAVAKAQAEVTQVMGDLRRSQEATPALVEYLRARTELQQKFEDMKVKFMEAMMPLAVLGIETITEVLPLVKIIADGLLDVAHSIPGLGDKIDAIRRRMAEKDVDAGMVDLAAEILRQDRPLFPFATDRPGAGWPFPGGAA